MSDFLKRLDLFLAARSQPSAVRQLTPDASTREYFRIDWKGGTAIACVYPEPFIAAEQSYLDVTGLFESGGLPVARIYDFDERLGVIVQEDLGDRILRDELIDAPAAKREGLIDEAIELIARIQTATRLAFERNSIASRLRFDEEKLMWELEFFKTHYFQTYRDSPLSVVDDSAIGAEFIDLCQDLASRASVLCHRDFHSANLMLDPHDSLRIIDHQDARIGSPTYDLVSLLLDRVTELPPPEWLAEKRRMLLDNRAGLGLEMIDEDDFAHEFRLQTVQRCLKAIGTFSYQSVNRGKTYFIPYIRPMFEIVYRALVNVQRFPNLQRIVAEQLVG